MDILLDNPLATMYVTLFLIFYGFVIFATLIGLAIAKSQIDNTDKLPLPAIPPQIDPYEIAYLRGGINEVARSVTFSLMQKGFIEIKTEEKTSDLNRINAQTSVSGLAQIEQFALNWIGTKREAKEVFDANYGLVQQLESYGVTYQVRLEQQQMLVGDDLKIRFKLWKWAAFSIILGLGGFKLIAALLTGYFNVLFIVVFAITGIAITAAMTKLPRITKLGKAYFDRLQLAFDNLKYQAQAPYIPTGQQYGVWQAAFAGTDPLLLSVGVFGSAILAGTIFDSYNQAFQKAQNQSAASGSSCGSGCGSSCSSSSGDGGSSCGGGCGGCGGGD